MNIKVKLTEEIKIPRIEESSAFDCILNAANFKRDSRIIDFECDGINCEKCICSANLLKRINKSEEE